MKAVGYLRVSTEDQNLGPEAQRAAIESWAGREGVEIVAWFEDRVSGAAPLDKRVELVLAIDALKDHGAGILVAAKRDRIARDVMLAVMIEKMVEKAGARLRTADGVGDEDSPEAVLLRRMIDVFAEYERAVIRARTKAALAVKKRRGEYVGGSRFGYQRQGTAMVRSEDSALPQIEAWRKQGWSYRQIATALNEAGVETSRKGRWQANTVRRILEREAA